MFAAFFLALRQFADPLIWRILAKSLAVTVLVFIVLGAATFLAFNWLYDYTGVDLSIPFAEILILLALGWLLWRVIAFAVLQFFADEVVHAVERQHYPAAAARARQLGWREELGLGLNGAIRAVALNLLALLAALFLLFTAIGPPLLFWLVNAALLGRELTVMVAARHRVSGDHTLPLRRGERFALGGIVAALFAVPFVNLLAPLLGAAMATHLVHRKELSK